MKFSLPLKLKIAAVLSFFVYGSCLGSDLQHADKYFAKQQYDLALTEYLLVAEERNARAFYQLGTMYYKGLGVQVDDFKALVWFSMAAEHNYDNATEIVDNLLANVPNDEKPKVQALIKSYQVSFSKRGVYRQHSPNMLADTLTEKILFDGQPDLNDVDIITDFEFNNSMFAMGNDNAEMGLDSYGGIDPLADENIIPFDAYFLIADYDIAPDGSIRNIIAVQTSGNVESSMYSLSLSALPMPTYQNQQTYFINRTFLGIASYNKLRMKREYNYFYVKLNRQVKELGQSKLPQDKYKQAMTLMIFPWLKQEQGDVDRLLKNSAEQGYMKAQYEYGLKLYRQQTDPSQAVHWMYQAAQQGHTQAKYRLGKTLLESPWVLKDEAKALFWLQEAATAGHIYAKQKSAEVKLLATDKELQDVEGAMLDLVDIAEQQAADPQYHYLQAIAHSKMENRQLAKAVKYIRVAIDLGNSLNWDVTPWQAQLTKWTTGGSVTIQEL